MANEELVQRGYLKTGKLKGEGYGDFEEVNIGATSVAELVSVGVAATVPESIDFPFTRKGPKKPGAAKPDRVFLRRTGGSLAPVAVAEYKAKKRFSASLLHAAAEQALYGAIALGVRVAIVTDGEKWHYIDVEGTVTGGKISYFAEHRDLNPAVLANLLAGDAAVAKDPKPLAEKVWQIIWHATKEEPKACLLTFIEIFVLKFLSDNLPSSQLADAHRFYELLLDPAEFKRKHGVTAIEYYVTTIRPQVKRLFPDKVVVGDAELARLFGLETLVSSTSIINGFAFLRSSSDQTLSSFNRVFREILDAFNTFGPLTTIDPEFKMRLYETFLRRSARQQKLGQFFTPRNIVRAMIHMARLGKLPQGSVVLDPAAGVGGFILEPLLIQDALPQNTRFEKGRALRRVRTVGVDVDPNTHILGKANMLLHLAEAVRDPKVTLTALNQAMAETFVLMNSNEALGALENPVRDAADVILTNPPYVTQGSRIYREEIANISGTRNGVDLRDYYEGSGLGLEALFVRYISGALRPGGRAFVIVPLGFLNRTEPGPKQRLLDECNVIGSIELPRSAFFNTAQPTNILILERRHTAKDARPDVFCALVGSIGETLDWRRTPTPEDNDLQAIADLFVAHSDGTNIRKKKNPRVKLVPADSFGKDNRWDVRRFWTDEELVDLGVREESVERLSFIEEASNQLQELLQELKAARDEIAKLTSAGSVRTVALSEEKLFSVRSGERVRTQDINENPGDVPVFSCFVEAHLTKGDVDADWLKKKGIPIETRPLVTVMANGAKAVGRVFVRREKKYTITDDVIAVEPLDATIDIDFLAIQLRSEIAKQNFVYEAKLFQGRVRELTVEMPVMASGKFDIKRQRDIASAVNRFDEIRQKLYSLGTWSREARIS